MNTLPHDPHRSEAQVPALLELLPPGPQRVLELGCGDGRILVPLARENHHVIGIDRDAGALEQCRSALAETNRSADLIQGDFVQWMRDANHAAPFNAILCLGNTFMTIADLDDAIELLTCAGRLLLPDGMFVLDDLPHDLWPELTEGNWLTGISEDGSKQLIWHPHDSIFTIREGAAINPESWDFKPGDVLYRMWTSSALAMAARLAGLSPPQRTPGLLVLRKRQ